MSKNSVSKKRGKMVSPTRRLLSSLPAFVAAITAVFSMFFAMSIFLRSSFFEPDSNLMISVDTNTPILEKLDDQQKAIEDIKYRIDALEKIDPAIKTGSQISVIISELNASKERLEILEKGLLDNPEKALSVPLLRNDLQNLEQNYKEDIGTLAKSIDRVYDQNKWFIGLMFTMAVGLIGLAISNFVQLRKKPEE